MKQSECFHLGIYGILEKDNNILLVKKTRGPYKGLWDLPGGRPEFGESIFETLKREIHEETGISILDYHFMKNEVYICDYFEEDQRVLMHHTCLIYRITSFDETEMTPNINLEDVEICQWHDKAFLDHTTITKATLSVLENS